MEPQTVIPLARSGGELKEIAGSRFKGIVNVLLTPDTVDYLLSINNNNRKVKRETVYAYEHDFESIGYECIALMTIDDNGDFADGQHRLLALKHLFAKGWKPEPIWQLVNLSVSKKMTESIDTGVTRSAVDTLYMHGTIPSLKIGRALVTYTLMTRRRSRKATADMLEKVYLNDFYHVCEIGEFGTISYGRSTGGRNTPTWIIAGFRLLQIAYGTENTQKAYAQFYDGDILTQPMVRFRTYVITQIFQGGSRHFRPWDTDTACGLTRMFAAADACIHNKDISRLCSKRLGITVGDTTF